MKLNKLIIIVGVIVIGYWLIDKPQSEEKSLPSQRKLKMKNAENMPLNSVNHKKNQQKSSNAKQKNFDHMNSEIVKELQPPDDLRLENSWRDEYGCGFAHPNDPGWCDHNYLNATFYKEALWMRDNNFPTLSMLNLAFDDSKQQQLEEMINKNYPPALAVSAIAAINNGDAALALDRASAYLSMSDKAKAFPHILYGEALLINGELGLAVTRFFIAGLLGDSMSNGRGLGLSTDMNFLTSKKNAAYDYLRTLYGSNFPKKPRPKFSSDGE